MITTENCQNPFSVFSLHLETREVTSTLDIFPQTPIHFFSDHCSPPTTLHLRCSTKLSWRRVFTNSGFLTQKQGASINWWDTNTSWFTEEGLKVNWAILKLQMSNGLSSVTMEQRFSRFKEASSYSLKTLNTRKDQLHTRRNNSFNIFSIQNLYIVSFGSTEAHKNFSIVKVMTNKKFYSINMFSIIW